MEIVGYERSRVLRFAQAFRPQGAPVVTEAFAKLIARYGFAKFPSLDDLKKEGPSVFETGKWKDVQIDEFVIYTDGYAAAGRCSTAILDEFLTDVVNWGAHEFGLTFLLPHRNEIYYETQLNIQARVDLGAIVQSPQTSTITRDLSKAFQLPYRLSGFMIDCDAGDVNANNRRRKPWRLFIERKGSFPYEDNLFFCQSPLTTIDTLALLEEIERSLIKSE